MIPKIYLAGKITKDCWRHKLIRGLRGADWKDSPLHCSHYYPSFYYVGPFFTSCDHGCFHGDSKHGMSGGSVSWCNEDIYISKRGVFGRCIKGVECSDVIFAYISTRDAFGTLAELGVALYLKKHVVICYGPEVTSEIKDDFWFVNSPSKKVYFNVLEEQVPEYFKLVIEDLHRLQVSRI